MTQNDVLEEIIAALTLKERVSIANMNTLNVIEVQRVFDRYVSKTGMGAVEDEDAFDLVEQLWLRLRETCLLRVVK